MYFKMSNSSDLAVTIDSLEMLSPYWQQTSQPSGQILHPNQTSTVLLDTSPGQCNADFDQLTTVRALGALIQGGNPPESTFPALNISFSNLRLTSPHAGGVALTPSMYHSRPSPPQSAAHIFPLIDPLDADILVHWSSPYLFKARHVDPTWRPIVTLSSQLSMSYADQSMRP